MAKIDFKTQTSRSTKFHTGFNNINVSLGNFEVGLETRKWGDNEEVEHKITFEIEGDKSEVIGDFMSESYYVCDVSNTTLSNWDREIGEDKAITFVWKKSSRGLKFERAYMYKFRATLILVSGVGNITEGIKEYWAMKETQKTSKKAISDKVEVASEDLVAEIKI